MQLPYELMPLSFGCFQVTSSTLRSQRVLQSPNYPTKIAVYNISDMSFSHTVDITEPIHRVQAGDCFDGKLYLNCDNREGKKTVYVLDLETGKTSFLFDRNLTGFSMEAEGLCVTADENGELTFHIFDYNKLLTTFLRTYKLK